MKLLFKLHSRNIFLLSALLFGLFAGNFAHTLKEYIIYILTFMMSLSLQSIPTKIFKPDLNLLKPVFLSIVLNYFLFSIVLLTLVYLLIPYDKELFLGFVLIAVSPPGVVIVPFAFQMKADVNWAAIGIIGSYLFLLLLFPITLLFLNVKVDFYEILKLLFYSVILPFFISRILRNLPTYNFVSKYQGKLIDLSFFALIYVVIGINNDLLINNFSLAVYPMIVFTILLFPITFLFIYVSKKLNLTKKAIINRTLMFSAKNNGFSAVTSLTLFGTVAAIPSAALSVVLLIYLIFFPAIIKLSALKD